MTETKKTTTKSTVPHVGGALANILKNLSVDKNGVLPGNMGGKPYITAVDVAAETKRQFVANDLIFIPNEEVVKHENIPTGDRGLKVTIVVRGTYTLVSTKDGSSVEISGTGDGIANGTAVASNIASTNALKNALLRTFLITEQSVEDESKNGPQESSNTPPPRAISQVKKAAPSKTGDSVDTLKARIREEFIGAKGIDKDAVNELVKQHQGKGKSGADLYKSVIADLEKISA